MMKKVLWVLLSSLMTLSLLLSSCGGEEEEETMPTEEEVVTPTEEEAITPTEEEVVTPTGEEEPRYGGTYTLERGDPSAWDPYMGSTWPCSIWLETVATMDYTNVPEEEWDFTTRYNPIKYLRGMLAESWEIDNMQTITFHIRQGVYWHDIPPVNGRELTAYDVEYSWHRLFGLGSGFTEPSPRVGTGNYGPPSKITATDKWTVVYESPTPSMENMRMILDDSPYASIVPREVIDMYGSMNDWQHQIGTGPFMYKDYVTASSITSVRNPNYWGYDESYPDNRLPYIDTLKYLNIPDDSTAYAALRTGKLDYMAGVPWEQAENLERTNPELIKKLSGGTCVTLIFRLDQPPFNNIKVRTAMQMAIDWEAIAESYYGGYSVSHPVGYIGRYFKGWYAEYEDWPQEVKDEYAYNPQGARAILAEGGYPDGLQFEIGVSSSTDLDLMQIVKDYLDDIDVEMNINVYEPAVYGQLQRTGKLDVRTSVAQNPTSPLGTLNVLSSQHNAYLTHRLNDPWFEEFVAKGKATIDEAELMKLCVEGDLYAIKQHWQLILPPRISASFTQPWVKRRYDAYVVSSAVDARLWIDEELKESMGY
jgi:peptide/nickel transport system substrate-binding protein